MNLRKVKALTFDVFGTVVDWRSSITAALSTAATSRLTSSLSSPLQETLHSTDWAVFAQAWRTSYGKFTRGFIPCQTPWKDIDRHHYDSLVELLSESGLDDVFSDKEVEELSRAWHFLTPWPDSSAGIHRLAAGDYIVATLSNGNTALLSDLNHHGNLGFQHLLSAEDFKKYKPHPQVYVGACAALGLQTGEVAMVAAHLGDLEAARREGMRTVYVERPGEEEWDSERVEEAREWVDVWVGEGKGGFEELARRLGV